MVLEYALDVINEKNILQKYMVSLKPSDTDIVFQKSLVIDQMKDNYYDVYIFKYHTKAGGEVPRGKQ